MAYCFYQNKILADTVTTGIIPNPFVIMDHLSVDDVYKIIEENKKFKQDQQDISSFLKRIQELENTISNLKSGDGTKRKCVKQIQPQPVQLRLENRFKDLEVEEMQIDPIAKKVLGTTNNTIKKPTNVRVVQAKRPPPITLTSCTQRQLKDLVQKSGLKDYSLRNKSVGICIQTTNKESTDTLIRTLQSEKVGFFTHRSKEDKLRKFVLSGLCRTPIDTIQSDLKEAGYTADEIIEIKPKISRYDDDYIYIIGFRNKEVKIEDLRKIRAINSTIIKWSMKSNKRNGPTQCRNCQMFGHGESFCHMPAKCKNCGSHHKTADCTPEQSKNPKCANCQGAHQSNDPACEGKRKFLEIRNKINEKSHRPAIKSKRDFIPASAPPPLTRSFANIASGQAPKQKPIPDTNSDELLNHEEAFTVLSDMITALKGCNTKGEQIAALSKIAIKYAFK